MTKPVVAYIRVSTARQGRSGLGLEAQQAAIGRFCETEGFEVVAEHVEVERARERTRSAGGRSWRRRSPRRSGGNVRFWWRSSIGSRGT
jgi:DNA invertase Pin-like site-specific DNA recombinase